MSGRAEGLLEPAGGESSALRRKATSCLPVAGASRAPGLDHVVI